MKFVVTCDFDLSGEMRTWLAEQVNQWAVSDQPAAVFAVGIHVAAQQPDGTWVRICHHEPEPDKEGVTA